MNQPIRYCNHKRNRLELIRNDNPYKGNKGNILIILIYLSF
jgi:hypothetical protein